MYSAVLVLVCLACGGYGRRVRLQSALERLQNTGPKRTNPLDMVDQLPTVQGLRKANQSSSRPIVANKINSPLKALAMFVNRLNPTAAYMPAAISAFSPMRSPKVTGPCLVAPGVVWKKELSPHRGHQIGITAAASMRAICNTSLTKGSKLVGMRSTWARLSMLLATWMLLRAPALASGGLPVTIPAEPLSQQALVARSVLWICLFSVASLFAGAETAITTLWPWKVKQLAAQEGERSPFRSLESDITTVLRTVLIGVTFCTIYSTALVTDVAVGLFGSRGVTYATIASTFVTLFFGEILPKSLAVSQPEKVARVALPIINALSWILYPLSWLTSTGTDLLLRILGADKDKTAESVTKPELRLVLNQAAEVGSVDLYEEDMIEGVLDLQRTQVQQVMTPRVDIEAVDQNCTLAELLSVALRTKYSRIPIYKETMDDIVGIVLTRELLGFSNIGTSSEAGEHVSHELPREGGKSGAKRALDILDDASLEYTMVSEVMEDVEGQFVPESMRAMNALKLMRQERVHMLFVVDEYGGTSGIVTLEDILETLVGEIYDEDDSEEQSLDTSQIVQSDDGSYTIDGMADIDVVLKRLQLEDVVPEKLADAYATLSGFLCHEAGQILAVGDVLLLAQWRFEVLEADERKLLSLRASNMSSVESLKLPTDGLISEELSA